MSQTQQQGLPWKRLYKIGKPFWVSEMRWFAIGNLGAVLALLCVDTALAIYISNIAGDFSTAMQQKASTDFYKYHDQVLDLLDDGTWKVYPAKRHEEFPKSLLQNPRPLCLMAPGECQ